MCTQLSMYNMCIQLEKQEHEKSGYFLTVPCRIFDMILNIRLKSISKNDTIRAQCFININIKYLDKLCGCVYGGECFFLSFLFHLLCPLMSTLADSLDRFVNNAYLNHIRLTMVILSIICLCEMNILCLNYFTRHD